MRRSLPSRGSAHAAPRARRRARRGSVCPEPRSPVVRAGAHSRVEGQAATPMIRPSIQPVHPFEQITRAHARAPRRPESAGRVRGWRRPDPKDQERPTRAVPEAARNDSASTHPLRAAAPAGQQVAPARAAPGTAAAPAAGCRRAGHRLRLDRLGRLRREARRREWRATGTAAGTVGRLGRRLLERRLAGAGVATTGAGVGAKVSTAVESGSGSASTSSEATVGSLLIDL